MSKFFIEVDGVRAMVERKDVKYIRMRVLPPDGRVCISMPKRAGIEAVKSFVKEKKDWIEEKQIQIKRMSEQQNICADTVMLWGKQMQVEVKTGADSNCAVTVGDKVVISVKDTLTEQLRTALINELCRRELMNRLPEVAEECEKRVGVTANEWRSRVMKTRWGSCNIVQKRIWINVRLAMLPPECLEHVVVHELCHLLEPSHNQHFKALMDEFYPDWRRVRKQMNSFSGILK